MSKPLSGHLESFLNELRTSYLAELPEKCDALETLVLLLNKPETFVKETYQDLYRRVHSLKGSGGTYGVSTISSVCHQFEDYMVTVENNLGNISDAFITNCLAYVDLLRKVAERASGNEEDLDVLNKELAALRAQSHPNKLMCVIVETSQTMASLYKSCLEHLPIQFVVIQDGLIALDRLLREKFDLVIMGNSLSTLNGEGVLAALRVSESINKKINVVSITSSHETHFLADAQPSVLLKKDEKVSAKLYDAVKALTIQKLA